MSSAPGRASASPALQAATLALAIDTLAWPLLLLHANGELLHANRAAATLLRRGQPLTLAQQQVQPSDEAQRNAFRAAHVPGGRFAIMYSGNHSPANPLQTLLDAAPVPPTDSPWHAAWAPMRERVAAAVARERRLDPFK